MFRLRLIAAALSVFALAGTASADLIRNISTGLDPTGTTLLPDMTTDSNYTVVDLNGAVYTPQARTQNDLPSSYVGDSAMPGSRWDYLLDQNGSDMIPSGNLIFTTTVDLTGFNPATALIKNLEVSADNAFLSVAIDGVTAFSVVPSPQPEDFHFVRTIGDVGLGDFHAGVNTIQLTIENEGFGFGTGPSPSALRVSATVDGAPFSSVVPEPSSVILMSLGGVAVATWRRRRSISQA